MKKSFIKECINKGFLKQCTAIEELKSLSNTKEITAYIGFDATAKSLHVGNLMQIMILRLLQKCGHKPIIIVGGATSKIGDPTGKEELRKVLSQQELEENIQGIKKSLSKFLKFGEGNNDAVILDNSAWLNQIGYIDFLREYGGIISVNKMLTMEAVKSRLSREQSLTFLEFNYMLLQAYDFAYLADKHNCSLQIGGSDQWGNIVMGVELVHKKYNKQVFGLTTPLITTASGAKMGKSVNGAIWLNEDMLSPYEYYQFWRNIDDKDIIRFAHIYGEYEENELKDLQKLVDTNINQAKKNLALKLTELCHGKQNALDAHTTAIKVFEEGLLGDNLPTIEIDSETLIQGIKAYDLLHLTNLSESKSEARKLIRGGGVKINDAKIDDENIIITNTAFIDDSIKISIGKKKIVKIIIKK